MKVHPRRPLLGVHPEFQPPETATSSSSPSPPLHPLLPHPLPLPFFPPLPPHSLHLPPPLLPPFLLFTLLFFLTLLLLLNLLIFLFLLPLLPLLLPPLLLTLFSLHCLKWVEERSCQRPFLLNFHKKTMVKSSRKIRVLEEKRKHLQLIALDTPPPPSGSSHTCSFYCDYFPF